MVWKRKPFCNIQPHEQHSPGGRHVTVNIYNQDFTRIIPVNDGKKKLCRRLGTAHDPKHTTLSVKHGVAM